MLEFILGLLMIAGILWSLIKVNNFFEMRSFDKELKKAKRDHDPIHEFRTEGDK